MREEIVKCDIKKCGKAGAKTVRMQVIFHTEQTEGRTVEPYLQTCEMDVCEDCMKRVLESGKYIHASGAQGHNEYYF